jgi:hypothetical protein
MFFGMEFGARATVSPMRLLLFGFLLVSAPAAAAPCVVEVVRAPEGVREVVDHWVAAEPQCAATLEVRIVETEGGLYVIARDARGHLHDRVVPDAQTAGVLIASWAADDAVSLAPPPPAARATTAMATTSEHRPGERVDAYPVSENLRPLTMPKGLTQLRLGLGTDLSAKGAVDSFGLDLEGQYGYTDNFTLIGGVTDAYNFKQFGVYFGFEGSLVHDLLDIRIAANLHRNAVPHYDDFCAPPRIPGQSTSTDNPAMDGICHNADQSVNPTQVVDTLPNGEFSPGGMQFSIDIGFPFRYAFSPEVALVALQTLMSIDFNSIATDHVLVIPADMALPGQAAFATQVVGNSAKPDLKPSIGLATNPIPQLSVTVFAQLRIPDFDTADGAFQIPVTGRIEASPSHQLDFGLELTLLNVAPPSGQSPIDNRFLSLFMQARY